MNLSYIKNGLAPSTVGIINTTQPAAKTFEAAILHPIVRQMCTQYRVGTYDQLGRQKIRNRKDVERICRAWFQGAYEMQFHLAGGTGACAYTADGNLNPDDPLGALALFIGGSMFRGGAMESVRAVWGVIDAEQREREGVAARARYRELQRAEDMSNDVRR